MSDETIVTSTQVVPDFIFGTLATDNLRLEALRRERSGIWHVLELDPLDPHPGEPVTLTVELGPAAPADRITLYYTTDDTLPAGSKGTATNGTAVEFVRDSVEWETLLWGYRERWKATIPAQDEATMVQYVVEAWQATATNSWWAGEPAGQVFGFAVDREVIPQWLREAVIYQIFVERFAPTPGSNFAQPVDPLGGFYGGTLQGIIDKLPYLEALGVTCLWLSPIFPSPTHHGYDATDYGAIEPRLGSEDDIRQLIEQAHQRGMKVIFDYVANHLSWEHPAFVEARQNQNAPTRNWFTFEEWPVHYRTFFGVQQMPQINTDDPGARAYLVEHARRWLELGCDGFRLDYANGPSHAFWSVFRAATRVVSEESVTIGETVETPELQRSYSGRLDGSLDFLLLQAMRGFFSFHSLPVTEFDSFLRRHFAFFGNDTVLPSFLDNHDMNRFLWTVGGDTRRLRLAALCQFTLPGPPIIYYGTEVGMNQTSDVRYADGSGHPEHSRMPMVWHDRQDARLLEFYRHLIALRREGGPVWQGPHTTLLSDDSRGLLVYACGPYIVALNNSPKSAEVMLPIADPPVATLETDEGIMWNGGRIQLPAYAGVCFRQS